MRRQYYGDPLLEAQDMFIDDFEELWDIITEEIDNRQTDLFNNGIVDDFTITINSGTELDIPAFVFYHDGNRVSVSSQTITVNVSSDTTYNLYIEATEEIEERTESRERRIASQKHKYTNYIETFSQTTGTEPTKVYIGSYTVSGGSVNTVDNTNKDFINPEFLDDTVQNYYKGWSSQKVVDYILTQFADYQPPVIATQTTPPASPSDDDRYIVQATGTGAWAGHDNEIAQWNTETDPDAWHFTSPSEGLTVYDQGVNYYKVWNGSAWVRLEGVLQLSEMAGDLDDISDGTNYIKFYKNIPLVTPSNYDEMEEISGFFRIPDGVTNEPISGGCYLATYCYDTNNTLQVAQQVNSNRRFVRQQVSNVWSAWQELPTDVDGATITQTSGQLAVDVTNFIDTSYGLTENSNTIRVNPDTDNFRFGTSGELQLNGTALGYDYIIAANNSSNAWKSLANAVCDGTSDQVEINAAITALTSGGSIFLAPGIYRISASISIGVSDLKIEGNGKTTIIEAVSGFTSGSMIDTGTARSGIIIKNLYISGTNQTTAVAGIRLYNSVESLIDNVLIIQTDSYGIYQADNVSNCRVNGLNNVNAVYYSSCNNIVNCVATMDIATQIGFQDSNEIINCSATDGGTGFSNCDKITNSKAEDNSTYGFTDCQQVTSCEANDTAGTFFSNGMYENCDFITNSKADSGLAGGFVDCTYVSNSNASRCNTFGFGGVDQIVNCYSFRNNIGLLDCHKISNCEIVQNNTNGMQWTAIANDKVIITNCDINNNGNDGILANSSLTNVTITGCRVQDNTQNGIRVQGNNAVVVGNNVVNNGFNGIQLTGNYNVCNSNFSNGNGGTYANIDTSSGTFSTVVGNNTAGVSLATAGSDSVANNL